MRRIFSFSAWLFTGPRSVTMPLSVMILQLWALVESAESFRTDLRMSAVMRVSDAELD